MSYLRFPNLGETLQVNMVGKLRKEIWSKDFKNCECNCNSTTKVKGTYAYGGECRAYCVVYKLACRLCILFDAGNTQNTLNVINKQHFQYVAQKVHHHKHLDTFAAHFDYRFNQKTTPQQCCQKMKLEILSTVNPIKGWKHRVNLHVCRAWKRY